MLGALDGVDAVVAVVGTTTLGVVSNVFVGSVVATWLAATVLPGPALPVAAEPDELALTPTDDDWPDSDL
ncbi:MAG: hypothetical protein JOZ49_22550 [Mycolicibacterium sp.]|nr:hypothetical protein [Mycolicibacterium sp.]